MKEKETKSEKILSSLNEMDRISVVKFLDTLIEVGILESWEAIGAERTKFIIKFRELK